MAGEKVSEERFGEDCVVIRILGIVAMAHGLHLNIRGDLRVIFIRSPQHHNVARPLHVL